MATKSNYPTLEHQNHLKFTKSYNLENIRNRVNHVYPIFETKQMDNRPYVNVKLFSKSITALLDSGANNSVVGEKGLKELELLKLKIRKYSEKSVLTADGKKQEITGIVDLPICVDECCKIIQTLVVPSIKSNFIFGSDFCRKFGIIIDFKENRWEVKNPQHSSIISEIKSINNDLGSIKVIRNWENLKQGKIEKVIEALKGLQKIRSSDRLGRTNKMIYTIDTGDAKPVKQRQYLMSPYMLSHLNKELDKMSLHKALGHLQYY